MTDLAYFYSDAFRARLRVHTEMMRAFPNLSSSAVYETLGITHEDMCRLVAAADRGDGLAVLPIGNGEVITTDADQLPDDIVPFAIDLDRFYGGKIGALVDSPNFFTRDAPEALIERRAPITTSSWNAETRTFECVFSTGAPVQRYDMRGAYAEFLAVDGFQGAEGAPFLDSHRRDSMDGVLGTVLSARTVGGEARATIKLSRHHPIADRLAAELEDGNRFGVSVGYTVEEWKEATDTKTGQRTKRATKWTVREISAVALPADRLATTRTSNMPPENPPANPPESNPTPPAAPPAVTQDNPPAPTEVRAETNVAIRSLARSLGLDQNWIDTQIDACRTEEQARQEALTAVIERGNRGNLPNHRTEIGNDYTDPDFRARTLGEALYTRVNPRHNPSEPARQYAGLSMIDMARDCLRVRGVAMTGLSTAKIVERALHSTSDFALILGDATGRTLMETYRVSESMLKQAGRQVNATDFRTRHRLKLSEGPELEALNESGEIKAGTLAEAKETYKLATYAKRVGISRQIIVNDDLGAFSDLARRMGQGAAVTEAKLIAKLLVDNAKLSDGKAMFHADHGNLAAAGAAPSVDTLSTARTAMRRQKTLQGNPMRVTPTFFVVPPELETLGEKILAEIAAAKVDDANPFAGRLKLVVESYLTNAAAWYLAAEPAETDGFEWSYLDGEEGPQIDTRSGWEIEGAEIKVRLDFGAGFVDHRGWFKNAGQ